MTPTLILQYSCLELLCVKKIIDIDTTHTHLQYAGMVYGKSIRAEVNAPRDLAGSPRQRTSDVRV